MSESSEPSSEQPTEKPSRLVWDVPTRLFHWLLVGSVLVSLVTIEIGTVDSMTLHIYAGYLVLTLILFRLAWGVFGTFHARFVNFLKGPASVLADLKSLFRKDKPHTEGHSPVGGWAVMVILLVLLVQAVSGLFVADEIYFMGGPMADMVEDTAAGKWFERVHHYNGEIVILVVLVLHMSAVTFYQLRGDPLINAMWHGKKPEATQYIESSSLALAAKLFLLAALIVLMVVNLP